jgi:alpha-tubulin suppressor-like RCC1 family protein
VVLYMCAHSDFRKMSATRTPHTHTHTHTHTQTHANTHARMRRTVDLVNDVARLLLPRVHIGQVSCGQKHGIALDSQGGAWSWGASDLGQCGLGTKDDVALPQRIQFFEGNVSTQSLKIKAVSAGWYHSLLLLDTGTAYACGENNIGQLGLEESEESKILFGERESELKKHDALPPGSDKENSWRKIQQIDSAHSVANLVYTPRHVTLGASQKGQDQLAVTAVAAGGRHSIFIDESGVAWACGLATDGQVCICARVCVCVSMRLCLCPCV